MSGKPVLLIILDGWGCGKKDAYDAVHLADTPNMDGWLANCPNTRLAAHDGAVGLPEGQMGNSEVGHLNLGAGRIVYQDYTRVNKAVADGELASNPAFTNLLETVHASKGALHLMGLLSDGGVHSHMDHLLAMVEIAAANGVEDILIHCFMDGRDTPPNSGAGYIARLQKGLAAIGRGRISTISGRYYAMDRDNRWDRVEMAWQALVNGNGVTGSDPVLAVEQAYQRGENDEFIKPIVLLPDDDGKAATIKDGDGVLFFNFRADRARQLTHAFVDSDFQEFERGTVPELADFVMCTQYEKNLDLPALFPPLSMDHILGQEVSSHGLKQLRIAETEKYAHVTYFFNGGREDVFENEDRILIESPRDVATYDLKPAMSAVEVTDTLLDRLHNQQDDLIILNFANGDMVGHTGILEAAIEACSTVDSCLGRLVPEYRERTGGTVLITADHGNAEMMFDVDNNSPHTAHTLNAVPLLMIGGPDGKHLKDGGALKDVAPTILRLMGLPIPKEMIGDSLVD